MARPKPHWNVPLLVADMTLRGWNAQELARRSQLSPKTVNRFLDGSVQTTKSAKKLARALGHSLNRYFSHVEAERRSIRASSASSARSAAGSPQG